MNIVPSSGSPFDAIRKTDEFSNEYWNARELMPLLGYAKWQRFEDAIARANAACKNGGNLVTEHFLPMSVKTSGRPQEDFMLSRLACYLIAMNGDPRKPEIANAQIYFAAKTRESEIGQSFKTPQTYLEALKALVASEEQKQMLEIENRLLEEQNEHLAEVVDELFNYSSIIRVAKFNNCSETNFHWRKLKAASVKLGAEIKKVPCPRFVEKNLYFHDAWRLAYPSAMLPETTTLTIVSPGK